VSGNDSEAKVAVAELLQSAFGWPAESVLDLGDISSARGAEMVLPLWVRLFGALGTADINFHIAGAPAHAPRAQTRASNSAAVAG
jgi:predicted dinucleotide-binding enzyme